MSHQAEERDNPTPLLRQETSNLSDYTVDSTSTFVNTPSPAATPGSVHHRTGYRRLASFNNADTAYHGPRHSPSSSQTLQEYGLGIKNLKPMPSPSPAGLSSSDAPSSANPLLSPPLLQSRSEHKQVDRERESDGDWDDYTSRPDPYQPFVASAETEQLRNQTTAPTAQSLDPQGTQS